MATTRKTVMEMYRLDNLADLNLIVERLFNSVSGIDGAVKTAFEGGAYCLEVIRDNRMFCENDKTIRIRPMTEQERTYTGVV